MPIRTAPSSGIVARALRWLKNQIVDEVPPEDALCEFDCRKEQCQFDEWATCERRLSRGAGEFMPNKSSPQKP